jgi:hypothetical protein
LLLAERPIDRLGRGAIIPIELVRVDPQRDRRIGPTGRRWW